MPDAAVEIPVFDLGPALAGGDASTHLATELATVGHEVGFFVVTGHGIDRTVVDDVFEWMHRFFALTADQKALIDKRTSRHFRGWEAVGSEFTNNRPDIREQIDIWSEWPARPAVVEPPYLRLLGPNQWLPDDVLPGGRRIVTEWFEQLGSLADRLLSLLAEGLGLAADHFAPAFRGETMSLTKLIRYPPTPAGGAGVNPHHDTGFLTVLAPGPTPGLQIEAPDGAWIDVPTVPGGFVINLGEMLQHMTGNYLVATPHRVVTATERFSAGYFHGPTLDTRLDPIALHPDHAAKVAASPRHRTAGVMAPRDELGDGVGDMASHHRPDTYGDQLWNYFVRSYPANVEAHYGPVTAG